MRQKVSKTTLSNKLVCTSPDVAFYPVKTGLSKLTAVLFVDNLSKYTYQNVNVYSMQHTRITSQIS